MLGVLVNTIAIVIGAIIGVIFKKALSEKVTSAVMISMGIATFIIGLQAALKVEKTLLLVISIAVGTAIGTIIDIDKYVNKLGEYLKKVFASKSKSESSAKFAEAFASSSILFAVGAMSVLGSIDAGLKHDYNILFIKSTMDFVASIMYTASLGIGVAFSAITILVFQGLVALFASNLKFLVDNPGMMNEFSAVGNLLVMTIGLNLMGVTKVKVANMLPAIVIVLILYKLIY
ncbi:MAG: DUF554 domain-containing protein [Lachnospiraceae bacterium]|nr:DUF554 domain-containing protein [Lachnospiraceae bacterium]